MSQNRINAEEVHIPLPTGAIYHAPQICLWAFSGAGAIAPISWPSLHEQFHCMNNTMYLNLVKEKL
jgi:hypothetical protein